MVRHPALVVVLVLHLVVAIAHGATHGLVPVLLPDWGNVLVLSTTFLGPLVGVVLDQRDHQLGLALFTISMAAAFALGVLLHFVVESPDHVHAVPANDWRLPFRLTAVAVAVTPGVGAVAGLWVGRGR
jgi:hypothetical protein